MAEGVLAQIFSHPDPYGALVVAGKTTVIYLFVVVGLRLSGQRQMGQMTVYDLVLIIVLANSVQNAMVGRDTTLVGGLVAATTLLLWDWLISVVLTRSPRLERLLVGEPVLVLREGRLLERQMRKVGVTGEEICAALREHGLEQPDQASLGVLEVDGTISIVPRDASVYRTRRHFRQFRLE